MSREMASKARAENEDLKKRIAELEKALGEKPKRAPRQAKPKET
jgi:BMFP domain-containing protein YqiC